MINRRQVVAGASASAIAAGAGGAFAQPQSQLRIRRDVNKLTGSSNDLMALNDAIAQMRQRNDSLSWDAQIAIHADMSQRHHASWRFLPWHRMQLLQFEAIVARLSGYAGFAMPYWDWQSDRIPQVFFDPTTQFYYPGRVAGPQDSLAAWRQMNNFVFEGRMTDSPATLLGRPREGEEWLRDTYGSAEWNAHNQVHSFVGGVMNDPATAPQDALFWFHHANVDRVWANWQSLAGGLESYPDAWRQEQLSGFVGPDGRLTPPVSAQDMVSTNAFGYRYDALNIIAFSRLLPGETVDRRAFSYEMQRTGPSSARVVIGPDAFLLLRDRGSNWSIDSKDQGASGFVRFDTTSSDAYRVELVYRDAGSGVILAREAMCGLPMMHGMGGAAYRFQLPQQASLKMDSLASSGLVMDVMAAPIWGRSQIASLPSLANLGFDIHLLKTAPRKFG